MTIENALRLIISINLVVIGLLVGIAWAERAPVEEFFHRWQTIAAGILAIVAALMTVLAMQWTEYRQQIRHEDLMRLTSRADGLVANRAAELLGPQLMLLARLADEMMLPQIRSDNVDGYEKLKMLDDFIANVRTCMQSIELQNAQKIFNGRHMRLLRDLGSHCEIFDHAMSGRFETEMDETGEHVVIASGFFKRMDRPTTLVSQSAREFAAALYDLSAEYSR